LLGDVGVDQFDPSESPAADQLGDVRELRTDGRLESDRQQPLLRLGEGDQFAGVGGGGHHGFLAENVNPLLQRRFGVRIVQRMRRDQDDRIQRFAGDHLVEIGVYRRLEALGTEELLAEGKALALDDVTQRNNLDL